MDITQKERFPVYYIALATIAVIAVLWYFFAPKVALLPTPAERVEAMESEARAYLSDEAKGPTDAQIKSAEDEARKYLNSSR